MLGGKLRVGPRLLEPLPHHAPVHLGVVDILAAGTPSPCTKGPLRASTGASLPAAGRRGRGLPAS
eukprot:11842696-Alexandrium_andersonii.AAC.1